MTEKILKKADIDKLRASVTGSGGVFVAPAVKARQVVYKEITGAGDMAGQYIIPENSYKEVVFPQTEVVARFAINKDGIDLAGTQLSPPDTVVFGARPCEAASLKSLKSVFTWDFIDEFYTRREEKLVVITIGCVKADEECFCTTVELSPETTDGADIYLREDEKGDFLAKAVTDTGKAFLEKHGDVFTDKPKAKAKLKDLIMPERIEGVDHEKISAWLADKENYEAPLWAELTRKCIGCGACTFSCPTCHCFDITDEGAAFEGERRKNWDACQFDHFTLHATGHNPRDAQFKRWRNRFMCKFNFYPNKFKSTGCVGCGRCIRVCPVRLDITEVMEEISKA
ncbi:MAG: 4Fe-4S dicluster domain-containing protein [Thermodesulfobacteriota bacterium]